MTTAERLARECGVQRAVLLRNARIMRIPRIINQNGKFIFDEKQSRMLKMLLKENVLTEELKIKIRGYICELLENTPAGYKVRLMDLKNFLISQHVKRDFCQYGFLYQLLDSKDFIIYEDAVHGKAVVMLSDKHEFSTEEATDERMNALMPYYYRDKVKIKVIR